MVQEQNVSIRLPSTEKTYSHLEASADRRPVDPPPVVELRIYEVHSDGRSEEDITFAYNANFFLFATLETSRPIANGRMHPSPPQIPVLTGMPVSGMAYLDRPEEAGYFIFPDLSVRHEGKYQLSFNLYEETKVKEDADPPGPANDKKPKISAPGAPESSFDWRLEIKSREFTVFSAKKFPGLAESTSLSRTVAEQGCRVRIRRDVRMRRRDKPSSEYEDSNAAEDGYVRAGHAAEQPNDPFNRERSNSAASDEGRDQQRRGSGEFPYPYQTPTPVAGPPPAAGNHLSFGAPPGQQYSGPPQSSQFAQPPPPPPPPAHQPYQSAPNHYPQAAPQYRPPPPPVQSGYPYERQHPQSAYPSNPPREHPFEAESFRRASAPYPPPNPQHGAPYPAVDSTFNRPAYQGFGRTDNGPAVRESLPPLKVNALLSSSPPLGLTHRIPPIAAPLLSPTFDRSREHFGPYHQLSAPIPGPMEMGQNRKRSFGNVFPSLSHNQNEPLHNGMRPTTSHMHDQDDHVEYSAALSYRRADGNQQQRLLPQP